MAPITSKAGPRFQSVGSFGRVRCDVGGTSGPMEKDDLILSRSTCATQSFLSLLLWFNSTRLQHGSHHPSRKHRKSSHFDIGTSPTAYNFDFGHSFYRIVPRCFTWCILLLIVIVANPLLSRQIQAQIYSPFWPFGSLQARVLFSPDFHMELLLQS